jgi:predicted DNA-binding transcriptional regulator AlpA
VPVELNGGTKPPNEFLSEAQLCQLLQVAPRTTALWREEGTGPKFIRVGKLKLRYRRADVDVWLAHRTFTARAEEAARSANDRAEAA